MEKKNKLRVGLSGLGAFSLVVGEGVKRSSKVELVACYDAVPERTAAASQKYGCAPAKSYEEMVKRDDIDGVLLVCPNVFHAEQAALAAQHGKHVYVEKPIANTLEDGRKMIDACKKAGVVLLVGHVLRRHGGNRKVKELIQSGAIGKPVMVEGNMSSAQGFELTPDQFRWRGDDTGCPAGALMTMGIHMVDVFNYILGPIKSVSSFFNKLYIPAQVEDVTTTIARFESGILGYLGSNFAAPRTNWIYVYGTEGTLFRSTVRPDRKFSEQVKTASSADRFSKLQLFQKGKDAPEDIPFSQGDPILEEIDEFADCVRTGAKPETDGQVGLTALAFIRAAIESARTGKPVDLKA